MISPGRIVYKLYFQPLGWMGKILKAGLRRSWEQERGRKAMIKVAYNLKEISYLGKEALDVYILTGKKYWYQTAFCLYSLQKQAGENVRAFIVDDGTFDDKLEMQVSFQFPTTVIIRSSKVLQLLDMYLPADVYPALRKRRIEYPHIRKLTDIHIIPSETPKLVLDSDLLFFKKPVAILEWLRNPHGLLFLKDHVESYGYSTSIMKELTQSPSIPNKLNVGVAGMPSYRIDWKKLEYWIYELNKREGTSYLQEQAVTAMIAATEIYRFLDEHEYRVLPEINTENITEILHHYVADSKFDYFIKAWKKAL